jgi:hypothetical protein
MFLKWPATWPIPGTPAGADGSRSVMRDRMLRCMLSSLRRVEASLLLLLCKLWLPLAVAAARKDALACLMLEQMLPLVVMFLLWLLLAVARSEAVACLMLDSKVRLVVTLLCLLCVPLLAVALLLA